MSSNPIPYDNPSRIDDDRLRSRGILPPPGIKVQRSQFGDGRPTIFCVTKVMADQIRKVTYTFDGRSWDPEV